MTKPQDSHSLSYYLGQFVGHIVSAVKADVTAPPSSPRASPPASPRHHDHAQQPTTGAVPTAADPSRIIRTEIQEATVDLPAGPVTLRRTTIDEVRPSS